MRQRRSKSVSTAYAKKMTKFKRYLYCLFSTGCLGAIFIPGTGNLDLTVSDVNISGVVYCESNKYLNFNDYSIEIYDADKLKTLIHADGSGNFFKEYSAKIGSHKAVLISNKKSKPIDIQEFKSDQNSKSAFLKLDACKKNATSRP